MSAVDETQPDTQSVAKILGAIRDLDAKVTAQVTALDAKVTALQGDVTALQGDVTALQVEMENQRDFQIDQERDRHSLLLSATAAARGSLPPRESNLTLSGARFITTRKDLKPASIY